MESTKSASDAAMLSVARGVVGARDLLEQSQPQRSPIPARGALTLLGVALVALQCAGLVFVMAALVWFPESAEGIRLRSPMGLVVVAFVLSGGMACIALVLKAMGFEVVRRAGSRHG
jgi:hypothetical protein